MENEIQQLNKLRAPFHDSAISLLPKPTKKKEECRPNQKCHECGGWHTPDVIHLKYVGHAALTDRLLAVDPFWTWEPLALDASGLPAFDKGGGLWIKLTILGVTRIGYGNAVLSQYKETGSREKEVIGDALRNAAMRFGCALELWHKGDWEPENFEIDEEPPPLPQLTPVEIFALNQERFLECNTKKKIADEYNRLFNLKEGIPIFTQAIGDTLIELIKKGRESAKAPVHPKLASLPPDLSEAAIAVCMEIIEATEKYTRQEFEACSELIQEQIDKLESPDDAIPVQEFFNKIIAEADNE